MLNEQQTKTLPQVVLPFSSTLDETPSSLFSSVIGHQAQKEELANVLRWFKNSKELKQKGVSVPKGVLLVGDPGNGKSLLIKEIIKNANVPTFVYEGDGEDVVSQINQLFKKARELSHSIVVFDELDLLIDRDRRVTRALQENLDGVESSDDILMLAATNYLPEIPNALLRNGRLEKIIRIPFPTKEEALDILIYYLGLFNISLSLDEVEKEELEIALSSTSAASIKAIANDVVLRNGFKDITLNKIYDSIFNVSQRVKGKQIQSNIQICVHEASHAFIASKYPTYFKVNRLTIGNMDGEFKANEVEEDYWPYPKCLAHIAICMAGAIGEKVLFGYSSRGVTSDLDKARATAYNLFNAIGYSSIWETLPRLDDTSRHETFIKRRKMERKIEKLLKKIEHQTTSLIKKNKQTILTLGESLLANKHLKSSEIVEILSR